MRSHLCPLVVTPIPLPSAILQVPGATYLTGFLTREGEERLVAFIDGCPWLPFKRRRIDFGYEYLVNRREVGRYLGPLPAILREVGAGLVAAGLMRDAPDQAIVQEYLRGQSIGPHTDIDAYGPDIVSVSLGQSARMVFTHRSGVKHTQILEPRSALALSGPARGEEWKHEIPAHRKDPSTDAPFARRLSVTFRTVPQNADRV
jgi:alkylated DNA repair dioxygenase AlkB